MVDRINAPHADEISKFNLPDFKKRVIANGIDLSVLFRKQQPVILLEIIIPVGRVDDPYPGLSYYVAKMLTEGTKSRNSNEIASQIDFYGGYIEISPTLDHVSIKLYAIKRFFKALFDVLIDLLSNPIFPAREFERLKRLRIEQIKQQQAKNSIVASLELRECLFGSNHPYGMQIGIEQASEVSLGQVVDFYQHFFLRIPKVYVAGDIGEEELSLIDQKFKHVRFDAYNPSGFPEGKATESKILEREDSIQSSLRMGKIVVDRSHKDTYLLKITNELLGGFFGSRLMKNIREDKGLTYGIHSSIIHLQHTSYWQISTDVLKEKREEAISEIIKEIKKLQKEAPEQEELLILKNYMKGKLLTSFDTIFNALELYKTTDLAGIQSDYWYDLFDAIDQITPDQISQCAQKHFSINEIRNIIVG